MAASAEFSYTLTVRSKAPGEPRSVDFDTLGLTTRVGDTENGSGIVRQSIVGLAEGDGDQSFAFLNATALRALEIVIRENGIASSADLVVTLIDQASGTREIPVHVSVDEPGRVLIDCLPSADADAYITGVSVRREPGGGEPEGDATVNDVHLLALVDRTPGH